MLGYGRVYGEGGVGTKKRKGKEGKRVGCFGLCVKRFGLLRQGWDVRLAFHL